MKIAIFSDNFYPELGGLQDSILSISTGLSRLGHEIHFFVPSFSGREFRQLGGMPQEIAVGPRVYIHRLRSVHVPSPTQQTRIAVPTGMRWRAVQKIRPDIIHTHTFFTVGLEAIRAARILKIPLVGTNHMPIAGFRDYSPIAKDAFVRYILKYVSWYYNHCAAVTVPSAWAAEEIKSAGLTRPVTVMSNPIDLETFSSPAGEAEKEALKKKLGLPARTLVFGGRLAPEKKVDILIRAVAEIRKVIPEILLVLAGHGSAYEALKQLVDDLGLQSNVRFAGTLSHDRLAELFRASELFVIASTAETQSMVSLQAMGCGLPVIAAASKGLLNSVTGKNGLHAEPDNPADFAAKIIFLLENGHEYEKIRSGALQSVQNFSTEKIVSDWEQFYQHHLPYH